MGEEKVPEEDGLEDRPDIWARLHAEVDAARDLGKNLVAANTRHFKVARESAERVKELEAKLAAMPQPVVIDEEATARAWRAFAKCPGGSVQSMLAALREVLGERVVVSGDSELRTENERMARDLDKHAECLGRCMSERDGLLKHRDTLAVESEGLRAENERLKAQLEAERDHVKLVERKLADKEEAIEYLTNGSRRDMPDYATVVEELGAMTVECGRLQEELERSPRELQISLYELKRASQRLLHTASYSYLLQVVRELNTVLRETRGNTVEQIVRTEVKQEAQRNNFRGDMPQPTLEDLSSPLFDAIWEVIKDWDVGAPRFYSGYCGASGSHVALILNRVKPLLMRPLSRRVPMLRAQFQQWLNNNITEHTSSAEDLAMLEGLLGLEFLDDATEDK